MLAYRFIEACALLPMLHVPPDKQNVVLCVGSHAEQFATDCLRWRDVTKVHLLAAPMLLRDKRVEIGLPRPGSCAAVLTSPDEPADVHAAALLPEGVFCVSTFGPTKVQALMRGVRALFPQSVAPWRDHVPEVLFGALASPRGAPRRKRNPPQGVRHLSAKYLPCLFTFAADETPLVFGPPPAKPEAAGATHG